MGMEDITPQTELATSSQPDAIANISNATIFNVDPATFKDNRDTWLPEAKRMSLPPIASRTVAESIRQSPEHAAAIAPDAKPLSEIEKIWGDIGNKINNKIGPERELNDLLYKKLTNDGKLTENDDLKLEGLKLDSQNNFGRTNYGLDGFLENLPGDVAAGITDMGALALRNKALIGTIAGGFAGTGAVAGALAAGPGGAVVGASAGLVPGLTAGFTTAAFYDGYKSMAGAAYGALDDQPVDAKNPPMDETTKKYLAHGVGVVAGGIQAVTDRVLLKGLPFVKNFLNPKLMAESLSQPAQSALRSALVNIGKSMATNAAGTGAQEVVNVVGQEIGNTYKNGEVSFVDGLIRAGQKLATNEQGATEKVGKSAAVGALVGAGIHGAFGGVEKGIEYVNEYKNGSVPIGTPEQPTIPAEMTTNGSTDQQAQQVLEFQNAVDESGKIIKQTGLHQQSPQMASDIREKILNNNDVKKVWFDKEDLAKVTKSDADALKVRNSLDPSGVAAAGINAPVPMEAHKFLDLHDEGLSVADYVKLHPEGPSPTAAETYAKNIEAANAKRTDLMTKLGVMGEKTPEERAAAVPLNLDMSIEEVQGALQSKEVADAYLQRLAKNAVHEKGNAPQLLAIENMRQRIQALRDILPDEVGAKATLKQALDTTFPENNIHNEQDFLTQPTYTKPIEGVLSAEEVAKKNAAIRESKQKIVDTIDETAKYEMNQVADIQAQEAIDIQKEMELEKLNNSMFLEVVDRFNNPLNEELLYRIDPKKMTPEQRAKYAKDPQIKIHKAFSKDGMSADESALMVGVSSGDALLEILSKTPTREEIAKTRAAMFEPSIKEEALQNTDLNHTAIAKAYHEKTSNDLETAQTMRDAHWSKVEKGIKRIALPLPKRVEELTFKAQNAVDQTKVSDLNVNQFKVGQRKSQKIALDAELKGDYEKAGIAKEAEALNTELTLATHVAVGDVNKVIKYTRRFKDTATMQTLKDAGSTYVKAVNEILDVFNFDSTKKGEAERGAFQKFVKDQIESGNSNFEVPERLSDVRQSVNDMTVEQVKVIGDRLRSILFQAKRKNELYAEYGPEAQKEDALNNLADQYHEEAIAHPDYSEKKSITKQGEFTLLEKASKAIISGLSAFKGMEHVILNADNGKVGGFLNEKVMARLKGVGKYAGEGEEGKHRDAIALQAHMEKIIEKFGSKEWMGLKNDKVDIPEFANNPRLNHGKLSKWNLFKMMLNMGNEGNQRRMAEGFSELDGNGNTLFATDIDTIRTVLDRELEGRHALAAQQIMDTYASYFPRVVKLHEETTGVTPEMVEAQPFAHQGKMYDGGYYPLVTEAEMSLDRIRKSTQQVIDAAAGETSLHLKDNFHADDMTKHTFTEKRTNSKLPIDITGGIGVGLEMLIHDLNFRKPIADALKIVTHPTIAKDLSNTVGLSDYNVVVNTIVRAAGSVQAENSLLFDSTKLFERLEAKARAGVQAGYLIGNLSSVMIQPTSMVHAVGRMGPSGAKHLVNVLGQLSKNPTLITDYYEFAGEINPMIRDVIQGLDENLKDPVKKLEPNKNFNQFTQALDNMSHKVNELGFKILGQADQIQKVVVTLSAYTQFLAGDAEGHSLESLNKMTTAEKDHAAKVYASSVARLTLTAGSPLDRAPIQQKYKWVTMFFNDARNSLNNTLRQGREIRQDFQAGKYYDTASGAVGMLATLAMIRGYSDIVRGYQTPWSGGGMNGYADKKFDHLPNAANLLSYIASSGPDVIAGDIPYLRDINYAWQTLADNPRYQKDPSIVPFKVFTDVGHTALLGLQFMDIVSGEKRLSRKDAKAIAFTASYLSPRGIPVNGLFKLYDALGKPSVQSPFTTSVVDDYMKKLDSFNKNHADDVAKEDLDLLNAIGSKLHPKKTSPLDKSNSEKKD